MPPSSDRLTAALPLAEPITLGSDVEDAFSFVCGLGLARGLLGSFATAVDEALRPVVGFERSCWHSVDPGTVLFTGSLNRNVGCSGSWLVSDSVIGSRRTSHRMACCSARPHG